MAGLVGVLKVDRKLGVAGIFDWGMAGDIGLDAIVDAIVDAMAAAARAGADWFGLSISTCNSLEIHNLFMLVL